MNAVVTTTQIGKMLILYLEPGNLHRLPQQPIAVDVRKYFPDGIPSQLSLLVAYSETPVADARELALLAESVKDERTPRNRTLPACPQCKSTIEQAGVGRNDTPVAFVFCVSCGAVLGVMPRDVVALI